MIFASLICRFRGHLWRRLRKTERTGLLQEESNPLRICSRCGASKEVKTRGKK